MFIKTRALVTGRYIDSRTYVLLNEDGSVFQEIKEGVEFRIDNQLRPWVPVRVYKENGKGTILVCRKFGDNGNVIEEFPLINNKKGLWALTSGAARNGVFHKYHEPETKLEACLQAVGSSKRVIEVVEEIDLELKVWGELENRFSKKWGFDYSTDAVVRRIETSDDELLDPCYMARFNGGTYVIYYSIDSTLNGTVVKHLEKVYITKDADENKVVEKLQKIFL